MCAGLGSDHSGCCWTARCASGAGRQRDERWRFGVGEVLAPTGVFSLLSPCCLPILPAYFSFTFGAQRHRVVAMSIAFFLGLATTIVVLGASYSPNARSPSTRIISCSFPLRTS